MIKTEATNQEIRTAWRLIMQTLVLNGLDFLLTDQIDTVVFALNKAMENNK